jgi:hypothetical protein
MRRIVNYISRQTKPESEIRNEDDGCGDGISLFTSGMLISASQLVSKSSLLAQYHGHHVFLV